MVGDRFRKSGRGVTRRGLFLCFPWTLHPGELLPTSWTEKSVTDQWGAVFIAITRFAGVAF